MEDRRGNRNTLYIVLVILGLLMSCGIGLLIGGTAGFFAGRRSAMASYGRQFGGMMPWLVTPEADSPQIPRMTPPPGMMPFVGEGAVVMTVVQDGPADRAGLRSGDVILAVDDQVLDQDNELRDVLASYNPGDTVNLVIRRQNDDFDVYVELGTNPDTSIATPWLGISYRMLAPAN